MSKSVLDILDGKKIGRTAPKDDNDEKDNNSFKRGKKKFNIDPRVALQMRFRNFRIASNKKNKSMHKKNISLEEFARIKREKDARKKKRKIKLARIDEERKARDEAIIAAVSARISFIESRDILGF